MPARTLALVLGACALGLAAPPASMAGAHAHRAQCGSAARRHHHRHACARVRRHPASHMRHGARTHGLSAPFLQSGGAPAGGQGADAAARCTDGSSPVAVEEETFLCGDGSEPACDGATVMTVSDAGALACAVPAAEGFDLQESCESQACETAEREAGCDGAPPPGEQGPPAQEGCEAAREPRGEDSQRLR